MLLYDVGVRIPCATSSLDPYVPLATDEIPEPKRGDVRFFD